MSAIQSVGTSIGKGIAKATNWKPPVWLGEKFVKDPEGALALATVTSIILKDGIGCGMYVTQSLNNKKIPDKKRKFVAALDLTNGVLMIAAQIGLFFAMKKYSGKIFNKLFKKSFNDLTKSHTISRIRMEAVKEGKNAPKKLLVEKSYEEAHKDGVNLFKFIADIAAATIVGKRIIVPLIATPLAKKVEARMNKNELKEEKNTETPKEPETKKLEQQPMTGKKLDIVETSNLLDKFKK